MHAPRCRTVHGRPARADTRRRKARQLSERECTLNGSPATSTSTHSKSDVAEGNFMLENKEMEIYARTPTPRTSDAGGTSLLLPGDVSDGLQSLRMYTESFFQEAGHQVPIENGQCLRTKPARDMSNKLVTPRGNTYPVQRPRGRGADSKDSTELNDRAHVVSAIVRIRKYLWSGHLGTMRNGFKGHFVGYRWSGFKHNCCRQK